MCEENAANALRSTDRSGEPLPRCLSRLTHAPLGPLWSSLSKIHFDRRVFPTIHSLPYQPHYFHWFRSLALCILCLFRLFSFPLTINDDYHMSFGLDDLSLIQINFPSTQFPPKTSIKIGSPANGRIYHNNALACAPPLSIILFNAFIFRILCTLILSKKLIIDSTKNALRIIRAALRSLAVKIKHSASLSSVFLFAAFVSNLFSAFNWVFRKLRKHTARIIEILRVIERENSPPPAARFSRSLNLLAIESKGGIKKSSAGDPRRHRNRQAKEQLRVIKNSRNESNWKTQRSRREMMRTRASNNN